MEQNKTIRQRIEEERFFRSVPVDRATLNEEKRTVEIAFSSEEPYLRWFGYEVLGHQKGEVDLSFMASGRAPFLVQHSHGDPVGVVERARIDADGKGRAVVRFGRSARAEEVFQDVKDGIRPNISVGYEITKATLISSKEGEPDTYRMSWRPFEASSVSVPADTTVGVGRSQKRNNFQRINIVENQNNNGNGQGEQWAPEVKERNRCGEILALGQRHGLGKEAAEAIQNGMSANKFRQFVLDSIPQPNVVEFAGRGDLAGGGRGPEQEFSISRYIASLIPGSHIDASREIGLSKALGKLHADNGRKIQGSLIPMGALSRGLNVGTATAGGNLVAENMLSGAFIEVLRARSLVMQLAPNVLTDLVGDAVIPRQTGGSSSYFLGEDEATTPSDATFDQIKLSPCTVAARTSYSRQAMLQSSVDLESFVRADLAKALGSALDLAAINGTGENNQPTGILNTSGIGAVVGGDTGAAPTYANVVNLWGAVADDNADAGSMAYLTNSKVVAKLMTTEKASGTGKFVIENLPDESGFTQILGMRCGCTNQVPSNLTKSTGSNLSAIICGQWRDLIIGLWGGLDILVDPYTDSAKGKVWVQAFLSFDVALRHPESFAAMVDALTT